MVVIVVVSIAVAAIAYRIRQHLFTKAEAVVLAIFGLNWLMLELQIVICDHRPFPEMRYWIQAGILLMGWTIWGIDQLATTLARRLKLARFVLPTLIIALALTEMVMITKAHLPLGRRYAYARMVEWASEKITADWQGVSADASIDYTNREYRQLNRPIISCCTARLAYVLNGRNDSLAEYCQDDTPDYLCDEEDEIDLSSPALHGARYELMDKFQVGHRTFALYRRN